MNPGEDVFKLIQSLSPAEKRYFRASCQEDSEKGPPLYLRLFDILGQQKEYDEVAVKAHFAGEPCLRQFTRIKNYLYESLLQALAAFHRGKHLEQKVRGDLEEVQILFKKALHAQAHKRLVRAKMSALRYELSTLLPDILHWERQILKLLRGKDLVRQLEVLEAEEKEALEILGKETEAYILHDKIMMQISQRVDTVEDEALPQLPSEHEASQTFNGRLAHLLGKALSERHAGNRENAHQHYRQILRHWEEAPHQQGAHPDRYLKAVAAFLYSAHSVGDYRDFDHLQSSIRLSRDLNGSSKSAILCISYNLRLLYLLNTRQFAAAEELSGPLAEELESSHSGQAHWLPAATNLGLMYFLMENRRQARYWFNLIIDLPRRDERRDLKELVRTLDLLVLFDQGEFELIPYFLKSLQRYIRSERSLNEMEKALGRFFSAAIRVTDRQELRLTLQQLQDRLEDLQGKESMVGLEELQIWGRSRLAGVSMRELLEREANGDRSREAGGAGGCGA
jgi:hypothetical protein